jgi:glycosyltransferase involved in cell wall biosynthesis
MTKCKSPAVSVIVPVFNQERFIGRCLRSLLDQSFEDANYEIIVVDDGSTDRTTYALELFHDAIRPIRLENNFGLSTAVNKGIHSSKGQYIVRVDSDDYVSRNFINFLNVFLEQNPTIDAAACDYWLCDDQENWLRRVNCMEEPIACGIMFRKEQLLRTGLYDEEFLVHEEREFRIRFEQQFKISHLELPLYRYRRHTGNITNDKVSMELHEKMLTKKHGQQ